MKKRVFPLLLALALIGALFPLSAAAADLPSTLAANGDFTMVVRNDGSLWLFDGYRYYCDEAGEYHYDPEKRMDNIMSVATDGKRLLIGENGKRFLAVDTDGGLWTWIANRTSLGAIHSEPIKMMENVASVAAGAGHYLVVKTDGTLWTWGDNRHGQLGDGTTTDRWWYEPVMVMEDVASVAAGNYHSLAIKTDGSLWGWGSDWSGELGDGCYETTRPSPVKIMDDVASVAAGWAHTLIVKTDGSLWGCGDNTEAQLGIKTPSGSRNGYYFNQQTTPAKIMDGVVTAAGGYMTSLAIKTDGSLWAWGGDTWDSPMSFSSPTPTKVMDGVVMAEISNYRFQAVKEDGTLWIWEASFHEGEYGRGVGYIQYPTMVMDNIKLPASPSTQAVDVDGRKVSFAMYALTDAKGGVTNYIRLRDLAAMLNGTAAQFEVGWDGKVSLSSKTPYTGASDSAPFSGPMPYKPYTDPTYIDGAPVTLEAIQIEHNGGGYTYYKLRDLGAALGFNVSWSAERGVFIETDKPYSAD